MRAFLLVKEADAVAKSNGYGLAPLYNGIFDESEHRLGYPPESVLLCTSVQLGRPHPELTIPELEYAPWVAVLRLVTTGSAEATTR